MIHITALQILNLSKVYRSNVNDDNNNLIDNFDTMDQIRSAYISEIHKKHDRKIVNIDELCEDLITYLTKKTCIIKKINANHVMTQFHLRHLGLNIRVQMQV
jgi:hypothetical protein